MDDGSCQLNPLNEDEGVVLGHNDGAGDQKEDVGELKQRIKELEEVLTEHWEYNNGKEDGSTPTLKVPAKPTEKERLEHEVTHTPPRPWCKFCIMGRGVRRAHRHNVPDTETEDGEPNKLSMDYMYLNDEDDRKDQPNLVLVDHRHGRVFSYGVPRKGVTGEAEWVPNRIIKDINNMGYKDVRIQINETRNQRLWPSKST